MNLVALVQHVIKLGSINKWRIHRNYSRLHLPGRALYLPAACRKQLFAAGKGIQGAGVMRLIIIKIKEIIELKHGCFF